MKFCPIECLLPIESSSFSAIWQVITERKTSASETVENPNWILFCYAMRFHINLTTTVVVASVKQHENVESVDGNENQQSAKWTWMNVNVIASISYYIIFLYLGSCQVENREVCHASSPSSILSALSLTFLSFHAFLSSIYRSSTLAALSPFSLLSHSLSVFSHCCLLFSSASNGIQI